MQVLKSEADGENIIAEENIRPNTQVHMYDTDKLLVTFTVKNTGNRRKKRIVQLYVRDMEASVIRPPKELKGLRRP